MKILHVNMTDSGGGLEQYLLRLSDELDRRGHENLLLYGETSCGHSLPFKAKLYFVDSITHPLCQGLSAKLAAVTEIVNQERPDLIFFHQVLNPNLVGLLSGNYPSLRFVHGYKMVCPDGRKTLSTKGVFCEYPLSYLCQIRAYGYKCMPRNIFQGIPAIRRSKRIARIHRQWSGIVVASQFMKNVMLSNGFREERIAVLPPFTALPELQSDVPKNHPPMIIALGRIVKEKGMQRLLQAFATLGQRATLVIIGEGPFLGDLKSLAERLGIHSAVSFPGWLSAKELEYYYGRCSLVIVPSLWPEPFGMVGIEAMAYSKPVIAFDVGGISEWLKHGETGYLVKPRDEESLAEKMTLLLGDRLLAARMGSKAREAVERRFMPETHVSSLLGVFQKEIAAFQKRRAVSPGH
jgi:glycosyltransferase involved in cell wall biosynthesis